MPFRPCPACQFQTPRLLEAASRDAHVHYYRCEACGRVWNIQKSNPDGPMVAVTVDRQLTKVRHGFTNGDRAALLVLGAEAKRT